MGRYGRAIAIVVTIVVVAVWLTQSYWAQQTWIPCGWVRPCPSPEAEARDAAERPEAAPPTPDTALGRLADLVPEEIRPAEVVETITEETWRIGAVPSYETLERRYGSEGFATPDAMPDEVRRFFFVRSEEVGALFGVPSAAIITFMQARDPDGELRVIAPEARSAQGVSGLTPDEWNGWAQPAAGRDYVEDVALIEQQGGVGFDWTYRHMLTAWQQGVPQSGVDGSRADPTRFENAMAAVARYLARQGITTALADEDADEYAARLEAVLAPQPAPSPDPALAALRAAFSERLDRAFGIRPAEARLAPLVDDSAIAAQVTVGTLPLGNGADQLFNEFVAEAIREGKNAQTEGRPLPWPFVTSYDDFDVQRAAVGLLGHTLPAWEVAAMDGAVTQVESTFGSSRDARLFAEVRQLIESKLNRNARGLPTPNSEVISYVRAGLAEMPLAGYSMRNSELQSYLARVEYRLRLTDEYYSLYGDRVFVSPPFDPMPQRVVKGFGSPASYQPDGVHTGLDLRGQRSGSKEPTLYAMDEGTVVHVGPLYCNQPKKCRGPFAVVIDHGNNIYTIYSHNSEAFVKAGDEVTAGQAIGRQGNEGYSRGSHLHLEVHVGARWSGDWVTPFYGGQFVDPLPWIPFVAPAS